MNAASRCVALVCVLGFMVWMAPGSRAAEWVEHTKLAANDAAFNSWFGQSVAVWGDIVLVGEPEDPLDLVPPAPGSAYIFTRDPGGVWSQMQKLTASDPTRGAEFGLSVSLNESWAIVGARGDTDCGVWTGSVYVFQNSGGVWTEAAKLLASDASIMASFGYSVSLSGSLAIIGAPYAGNQEGAAYIFENTGDTWSEVAKLTATDGIPFDQFGSAVDISGSTAIVGAWRAENSGQRRGSAYVFEDTGQGWSQVAKLTSYDPQDNQRFGTEVAIEDGLALVGAPGDHNAGTYTGAVYPYRKVIGTWQGDNKLIASIAARSGSFGWPIDIDGTTAAIGGYDRRTTSRLVYVFEYGGTSWTEVDMLFASDGRSGDAFGGAISLDGTRLLVGSPRNDNRQIVRIGDANRDRRIDATDLSIWQTHYDPLGLNGDVNSFTRGDWNDDNLIDGGDLALWQQNYDPLGLDRSGAAYVFEEVVDPTGARPQPIPEPGTLLLLGAGVAVLIRRRR